jgi:cardiolipin synthase
MMQLLQEWLPYYAPLLFVIDGIIIIITAGHIVLTKRDSRSAIGWVGVVFLTPFIGALLYVVFGVNRIQRRAHSMLEGQTKPEGSPGLTHAAQEHIENTIKPVADNLLPLTKFIGRVTNLPLLAGNRVTPFFDGDAAYGAMFAAIERAQKTLP